MPKRILRGRKARLGLVSNGVTLADLDAAATYATKCLESAKACHKCQPGEPWAKQIGYYSHSLAFVAHLKAIINQYR